MTEELPTIDDLINTLQRVKSNYIDGGSIKIGITELNALQGKTFSVSNPSMQVIKTSKDKKEYVAVLLY